MSDLLTIRDKVTRYTTRVFDDVMVDEDGDLSVQVGSTRLYIHVIELTDPEQVEFRKKHNLFKFAINVYAIVLFGVQETPEFFKWIATEGQGYDLGNFKAVKQNEGNLYNLIFQEAIVADDLDETELRSVLWAIAGTSDGSDDELVQKFGGSRALDS